MLLLSGVMLLSFSLATAYPQETKPNLERNPSSSSRTDAARFNACRVSRQLWFEGKNQEELVECLKDLFAASYDNLRSSRGLPSMGAPSLEPLIVESATVRDSSVFTGTVTNLKVNGFSEAFLRENVEVIPPKDDSGRVTIRMKGKSLKLRGDFDAVANILKSVLPFYSGPPSKVKGLFEGFIDDPVLTVNAVYVPDADKGASLDGLRLSFNFGRSNVRLSNDELISGTVLSLLNNLLADSDVSRTVINEVVPEVLIKFQEPMYNILDRGLDDAIEILS